MLCDMPTLLHRALSRRVSVEQLIEITLWVAIPYLLIGIGWAFLHPEQIAHVEAVLQTRVPAGANLIAFGHAIANWPLLLISPQWCGG